MQDLRFEKFWPVIFEHEVGSTKDGFVDHKNDAGGVTKYGISLRFLLQQKIDINGDGKINRFDIYDLTKEDSKEICYEVFYKGARLQLIKSDELALELLDMGINSGFKTAIILLQELLKVKADGIIGIMTINAIENYRGNIISDYKKKRVSYYNLISELRPENKVFLKGWLKRVETTILA